MKRIVLPGLLAVAIVLGYGLAAGQVDGTERIAFAAWNEDRETMTLRLMNPDGSELTTLVEGGVFAYPRWSPDGRQLAFIGATSSSESPNLYVINSDGSGLHAVIGDGPTLPEPGCASWLPDASGLLFGAQNTAHRIDIYHVQADGSALERIRLAGVPSAFAGVPGDAGTLCPVVLPEGDRFAVSSYLDQLLYLVTLDGSSADLFPAVPADALSTIEVAWSPDGQRAVIGSGWGGDFKPLVITTADGMQELARIEPPPGNMSGMTWSPDGTHIAFIANEPVFDTFAKVIIWTASADGGDLRPLQLPELYQVAFTGLSWGRVPADMSSPAGPVQLADAAIP